MTVKLDLTPDVEAGLLAQAQTHGLSLEGFLTQIAQQHSRVTSPLSGDAWERELDALTGDVSEIPVLSDEAMKRSNWYSDRG